MRLFSEKNSAKNDFLNIFGKKLLELVKADKIEQAFNLGEKLSELERFNLLAPYTGISPGATVPSA